MYIKTNKHTSSCVHKPYVSAQNGRKLIDYHETEHFIALFSIQDNPDHIVRDRFYAHSLKLEKICRDYGFLTSCVVAWSKYI